MEKFNDKQIEELKKHFSISETEKYFILTFKENKKHSRFIWFDKEKEDSFLDQFYIYLQSFENDLEMIVSTTLENYLNLLKKIYEKLEKLN